MSTNDDSASRRARRADQGERRGLGRQDERWDQSSSRDRAAADPYLDQRGRDGQSQRGYSNFSRHPYSNQQEPAQPQAANYYPEPARSDSVRYPEPVAPAYTPAPQPYEPEPPHLNFQDGGRDDLFSRDPSGSAYAQNSYAPQGSVYQADPYEQNRGHQPMTQQAAGRRDDPQYAQRDIAQSPLDDYERSFSARQAQETQASRFFLPDDEPQKQRAAQPERAYAPAPAQPQYASNLYPPQDNYDTRYDESWAEEPPLQDGGGGHNDLVPQGNDLDEDFFADEDEFENDHVPAPKRSRKKLIAAALAGAIVVGGTGAYLYKSAKGGGEESATPYIRADNRPLKELPGNPGGKQFPNGEKTIYDRLTPDGQQVQAAAYAPTLPAAQNSAAPPAGNSLEERIDEALRRAQQTGDAAQPAPAQTARASDQPTVVRSESYRPDGTRVETARPTVTPGFADASSGQLPPPFGSASPAPAQPQLAPFRTVPVPSSSAPQMAAAAPAPAPRNAQPTPRSASITPAEPSSTPSGGFYVSLKSAPDEKAIQKDLTMLTDKYKSVLGDVQLTSKIADLGARGVTYRAVAGPLGSRQEAMDLCQKIKGVGGDKACFVTN